MSCPAGTVITLPAIGELPVMVSDPTVGIISTGIIMIGAVPDN